MSMSKSLFIVTLALTSVGANANSQSQQGQDTTLQSVRIRENSGTSFGLGLNWVRDKAGNVAEVELKAKLFYYGRLVSYSKEGLQDFPIPAVPGVELEFTSRVVAPGANQARDPRADYQYGHMLGNTRMQDGAYIMPVDNFRKMDKRQLEKMILQELNPDAGLEGSDPSDNGERGIPRSTTGWDPYKGAWIRYRADNPKVNQDILQLAVLESFTADKDRDHIGPAQLTPSKNSWHNAANRITAFFYDLPVDQVDESEIYHSQQMMLRLGFDGQPGPMGGIQATFMPRPLTETQVSRVMMGTAGARSQNHIVDHDQDSQGKKSSTRKETSQANRVKAALGLGGGNQENQAFQPEWGGSTGMDLVVHANTDLTLYFETDRDEPMNLKKNGKIVDQTHKIKVQLKAGESSRAFKHVDAYKSLRIRVVYKENGDEKTEAITVPRNERKEDQD